MCAFDEFQEDRPGSSPSAGQAPPTNCHIDHINIRRGPDTVFYITSKNHQIHALAHGYPIGKDKCLRANSEVRHNQAWLPLSLTTFGLHWIYYILPLYLISRNRYKLCSEIWNMKQGGR